MDELPHGGCNELRDIAIDTARRALNEAGYDVELGSSLPADLVAIGNCSVQQKGLAGKFAR